MLAAVSVCSTMKSAWRLILCSLLIVASSFTWGQASTPEGALEEMLTTDKVEIFARHLPVKLLDALNQQGEAHKAATLAKFLATIRTDKPIGTVQKSTDGHTWEFIARGIQTDIVLTHSFISGTDAFLNLKLKRKIEVPRQYRLEKNIFVSMCMEDGEWRVIDFGNLSPEKNFESDDFIQWTVPGHENEVGAATLLRTINTVLVTYSTTYPDAGFPPSFKELACSDGGDPSKEHACLLDSRFNQERVIIDGYEFRYSQSEDGYQVTATPVEYGKTGSRSFFTDESVVLRVTSKNRPANEDDDPLD